jgi:restriction endonuclease S subunit
MPEIQLKQVDELIDEVAELPTILDKVIQTADEKLFGTSENLSTADPIELLVKGIERVTKREAEITRVTLEDRKKTGFKIGKFEFSRSKRI